MQFRLVNGLKTKFFFLHTQYITYKYTSILQQQTLKTAANVSNVKDYGSSNLLERTNYDTFLDHNLSGEVKPNYSKRDLK